jgi:hypothetical protein
LELFSAKLTLPVSLPSPDLIRGLTGQSGIHGRCLLDRPVKASTSVQPGDDGIVGINLIEMLQRGSV